jgi:hypothetical protein
MDAVLVPPGPDMNIFTQVDMLGIQSGLVPVQGFLPCIISQSPIYVVEER